MAHELMSDLHQRLARRVQLTTDGLSAYVEAVEDVFSGWIDYAQLVKEFGSGKRSRAWGDHYERKYSPRAWWSTLPVRARCSSRSVRSASLRRLRASASTT